MNAMIATMAAGFAQGIVGYADDMMAQGAPWSFGAATITVPVHVHHGGLDSLVPIAHAEHNAEIIPTATLRVWPGHGHLSLVTEVGEILAPLVADLR
jgi:pimeloyl-ACP methyl ester carboxylesterase